MRHFEYISLIDCVSAHLPRAKESFHDVVTALIVIQGKVLRE